MKTYRILHIDDDPATLEIYRKLLSQDIGSIFGEQSAPPTIDQASDWSSARNALAAGKPDQYDLIIFDMRFPDSPADTSEIHQHDRLPEVRRLQPNATVVVATSYAYEEGLKTCNEVLHRQWADGFLPKDVAWEQIVERLRIARESTTQSALAPLRLDLIQTVTEDVESCLSDCQSRIRAITRGTLMEAETDIAMRRVRQEISVILQPLSDLISFESEGLSIDELLRKLRTHYLNQTGQELRCCGHGENIRTYRNDLEIALWAVFQNGLDAVRDLAGELPPEAVRIEVVRQNGRLVISVVDRGDGFSQDALANLYNPRNSGWKHGDGYHRGMGLHVARRRLFSIGGDLKISRDPEAQETRVSLSLFDWGPAR